MQLRSLGVISFLRVMGEQRRGRNPPTPGHPLSAGTLPALLQGFQDTREADLAVSAPGGPGCLSFVAQPGFRGEAWAGWLTGVTGVSDGGTEFQLCTKPVWSLACAGGSGPQEFRNLTWKNRAHI